MSAYPSFDALLGLTAGGVTLHNALQYAVRRAVAGLTQVATDVETGNVKALQHDAAGIVDYVETHVPGVAKAVDTAKADAEAEVAKLRHAAAEELRKLAESVEKLAPSDGSTGAPTGAVAAPAASQA